MPIYGGHVGPRVPLTKLPPTRTVLAGIAAGAALTVLVLGVARLLFGPAPRYYANFDDAVAATHDELAAVGLDVDASQPIEDGRLLELTVGVDCAWGPTIDTVITNPMKGTFIYGGVFVDRVDLPAAICSARG